jgi:hypothetical protein
VSGTVREWSSLGYGDGLLIYFAADLLRGRPARWHMIWCEVNDFAGRALKYVVVFRRANVHHCASQRHRSPAIRAYGVLWHNIGYVFRRI